MKKNEMHPDLKLFIDEIHELINKELTEEELTSAIAEEMEKIVKNKEAFPKKFWQPNSKKYTLYPIYIAQDNSFSIASAVWDVGQSTPIHDHGTWGVIGLIQGSEKETHYDISRLGPPKPTEERYLNEGEVMVCCTTD